MSYKAIIGALILSLILCRSWAFPAGARPYLIVEGKDLNYSVNDKIARGSGQVQITMDGMLLKAQDIEVNLAQNKIIAQGHVVLSSGDQTLTGEALTYNISNKKGNIITQQSERKNVDFKTDPLTITSEKPDNPPANLAFSDIPKTSMRLVGKRMIIHANQFLRMEPATMQVNGRKTFSLPFYNASLGGGAMYTQPQIRVSAYGPDLDFPLIYGMSRNLISIAHLKYSKYQNTSLSLEYQYYPSARVQANFYFDYLNQPLNRQARMQLRQQLGKKTNASYSFDWYQDSRANASLYLYHNLKSSTLNLQLSGRKDANSNAFITPSFALNWNMYGKPLIKRLLTYNLTAGRGFNYTPGFSGGYNNAPKVKNEPIWFNTAGVGLNVPSLRLGKKAQIYASVNSQKYWHGDGMTKLSMYGNLTLSRKISPTLDTRLNYNYNLYESQSGSSIGSFAPLSTVNRSSILSFSLGYNKNKFNAHIDCYYDIREQDFTYINSYVDLRLGKLLELSLSPTYDFRQKKINWNYYLQRVTF